MPNSAGAGGTAFAATPIRAVFFDAGETLHRLTTSRADLLISVMAEAGLPLPPAVRIALHEQETDAISRFWDGCNLLYRDELTGQRYLAGECRALLDRQGVRARREQVEAVARGIVRPSWRRLFPDAFPTLSALRTRFRLGIISNAGSYLARVYEDLGVRHRVDFMITSGEVGIEKPDPAIFALALKKAGVPPEEALHVGDNLLTDVAGARGAGIRPILLSRSAGGPSPEGCHSISSLVELLPLLGVSVG